MHEFSLIANLLKKIEGVASDHQAEKATKIKVSLGALSHISADHFREHFLQESKGTVAEGAELEIEELSNIHDQYAQDIFLESVELEGLEEKLS